MPYELAPHQPEKPPEVPFYLTQEEYTTIYMALMDFNRDGAPQWEWYREDLRAEKKKEILAKRDKVAGNLVNQIQQYRRKNTTKDDAGVIHIPLFGKKSYLFTYACRRCGGTMTIEADDGHPAWQYWTQQHKCSKG